MRQPESAHRKTQTPIVAKQIENDMGILIHILSEEFAILPNPKDSMQKKGYDMPQKTKISPYIKYSICLAIKVYHNFWNL